MFFRHLVSVLLTLISIVAVPVLGQQSQATPVFVAEVTRENFYDEIEALGTLRANEYVALTSSVVELVTDIKFDDGQRVQKGDVLVVMDSSSEEALIEEEQSRINEARRQVERLQPLVKRNASSKSLLDEAELELKTAQARLRELNTRLLERTIRAPFDGILGFRNISIGTLLQQGTLITTIDDDSVMKLDFSVPEVFLGDLRPGLIIEATTSAYPDVSFKGHISSLDSRIDPITRSLSARALLDNTDHKLKPGLLMQVKLQGRPRDSLVIPEEALLVRGEQKYVYTIERENESAVEGIAKRTIVETGGRRKGYVEILNGLSSDELVVIHGTLKIREASKVKTSAIEKNAVTLSELLQQVSNTGS